MADARRSSERHFKSRKRYAFPPTYGNLPVLNGYLEMQQLYNGGLSLTQIFKAATINNARKLKLDAQLGTIELGKTANILLLTKSALQSLDA